MDQCNAVYQAIGVNVVITADVDPAATLGEFEIVDAIIAAGGHAVSYSPADFRFIAKGGKTYYADGSAPSSESLSPLTAGTLPGGESATGQVVFDVPPGGGEVTYTSELGGSVATWHVQS